MRAPLFDEPRWRYALIFSVYAYQGVVSGFAVTALPNHWVGQGASTAEVGAHVALVGLPWVAQPLWGPLVDRFGNGAMGARRPWMLGAMLLSLLALALLPAVAEAGARGAARAVGLLLLLHSAAAALLDTATDALVIDRVPAAQLGRSNACTRAGLVTGLATGAAVTGALLPDLGIAGVAPLLLAVGALACLAPLLIRETCDDAWLSWRARTRTVAARPDLRRFTRRLCATMRRRTALTLLALCVVEEFAGATFATRLSVAILESGDWEPAALSRLQGALALLAGTAGALVVGAWADRIGATRALARLLRLTAVGFGVAGGLITIGALGAVGPLALGLTTVLPVLVFVALAPAVMRASRGGATATRFALFMAALNLGGVAGAAAAGPIAAVLPLPIMAIVAAAVFVACAAVAARPALLGLDAPPDRPGAAGTP